MVSRRTNRPLSDLTVQAGSNTVHRQTDCLSRRHLPLETEITRRLAAPFPREGAAGQPGCQGPVAELARR